MLAVRRLFWIEEITKLCARWILSAGVAKQRCSKYNGPGSSDLNYIVCQSLWAPESYRPALQKTLNGAPDRRAVPHASGSHEVSLVSFTLRLALMQFMPFWRVSRPYSRFSLRVGTRRVRRFRAICAGSMLGGAGAVPC